MKNEHKNYSKIFLEIIFNILYFKIMIEKEDLYLKKGFLQIFKNEKILTIVLSNAKTSF